MLQALRTSTTPQANAATPLVGSRARRRSRRAAACAAVLLGAAVASCSGSSSPSVGNPGEGGDNGTTFYFGDPNAGGAAQAFRLTSVQYGRLVQLFGLDGMGRPVPMGDDFVISQRLTTDDVDYQLTTNAVTGQENLTVLRNVDDPAERAEFLDLVRAAGDSLDTIQVQDLMTAGVFSLMPRNAAVLLQFDDLLRPSTIDRTTIQIVTGDPPTQPFEARIFPSTYYGDEGSDGNFYPTRVVIDFTVSEIEAFQTDPPLVINGIGLPPSLQVDRANGQLRIPTRTNVAVGLTKVLTNLTNHVLATTNNGPVDFSASTRPVTRAFRTGGRPDLIADPSNGFLRDVLPPVVVGSTPVNVVQAPVQVGGPDSVLFRIPLLRFSSELCSSPPERDDVIVQSGVFAQVVTDAPPPVAGDVSDVLVQLLLFPDAWAGPGDWEIFGIGAGTFQTAFAPLVDGQRPECFVLASPQPTGFPDEPGTGLSTASRMTLRFSEPMDPLSLTAFDSLTLTREPIPPTGNLATSDYVVGRVAQSADLRNVTFVPDQLLAHQQGTSESYFLTLADVDDSFPPRDLAGNVVESIPALELTVDPNQGTQLNGGRVSRFTSIDEEPCEGFPEWGGQFLVDSARELIRPRPIVRSQVAIDEQQAIVRQMTQFPQGVVTPLSQFGSKMQTLWRYADCGFSLTESQNMNIDVEGLNWAPAGGVITPDAFGQFEIRLAHCNYAPDEIINPTSLFPMFQNSGLRPNYEQNLLPGQPQVVVHPRQRGYMVSAGNLFQTITGTTLLPFPMNRTVPVENFTYYTWRDTSIRTRAGSSNGGVDPMAYLLALGITPPALPFYRPGQVQTAGLPLLMEFRTYPDPNAVGLNAWVLALAVNSSSRPYFRAFSTGGINQGGSNVFIDPDAETMSNGGFNPASSTPGAPTYGRDNSVHIGAIDYVTRLSRVHSIWFESPIDSEPNFVSRRYNPPTLEPNSADQPPGTSINVDFRGATEIEYLDTADYMTDNDQDDDGIVDYTCDAFTLDLYGDFYNEIDGPLNHDSNVANSGLSFLGGSDDWRDTVDEIDDARFYQVRLTFAGNTATGQTAELSAFALTWTQN